MKTLQIFSLIFFASCSVELPETPLMLRSGDYITYNPLTGCVGQEATVIFDNSYGNNCGTSRIQQRINETWTTVSEDIPYNGILAYSFVPQAPGSYRFRASWNKSGRDCPGENIKPFEEDPLEVVEDCCRDYFTVTAICDPARECPYGLELHFMTTIDNWISIIGQLPDGYEFCGLYDGDGLIIEEYSGNLMEIIADVPACMEFFLYAYFNAPVDYPTFGSWTVKDMHEILYRVDPAPCEAWGR